MNLLVIKEQPEKEKVKEIRPGVSLASYRPFFRELDMEVLSVLQCGLLSRSLLDSELHTKVNKRFWKRVLLKCILQLYHMHHLNQANVFALLRCERRFCWALLSSSSSWRICFAN